MKQIILTTISVIVIIILFVNTSFPGNDIIKNSKDNVHNTSIYDLSKGVSIYQLDNGLQVLFIENHALPVIGINAIVKTGSAFESFSTSGASHLLEHLLFNGTTTRDQKQLYDDVDRIGAYNNATTENFFTDFMFVVPIENAEKGFEIQADMLFNSIIPADKYQKEKKIVLEEISKSIADPNEQIERNTISILYAGHALSLPTLGTYSTVEGISRDEVFSFYKNNYVPNNIILTIIGNFNTSSILPVINNIYGKAKPGLVIRPADADWGTGYQTVSMNSIDAGAVYHRFYGGKEKVLQLFFDLPSQKSSEYYNLISYVLDKSKDSILTLLKKKFPQVKLLSLSTHLSHLGNYFEGRITFAENPDYNEVSKFLSEKLGGLSFKLSAETVETEAVKVKTESARNIEKPHMFGIYYSDKIVKEGIEALLNSFRGSLYSSAAKELEKFTIPGYHFSIIETPSLKSDESNQKKTSVTRYYNDSTSGRKLIIVKNEENNLLAIHYLIKHKAYYEAKYGKDASKILHDIIEQRLTSDKIEKISNKFGLTYTVNDNPFISMDDIYLHPDFGYIRIEGLAEDVQGAIKFLNSQLKNFVPTEAEFNKAVEKYKGIGFALAGGDKGKKLFDREYSNLVFEQSRYSENTKTLTFDNLLAFTKEYLTPSNIVISVVSPAEPDTVYKAFSSFSAPEKIDEPPVYAPEYHLPDKPVTIEKNNGGERSYLFWGFIKKIDPVDEPALEALSLILNEQIEFDIREKQGLAYHLTAGIDVVNDKALFYINQGTRPQNVALLINQYPGFFQSSVVDSLTEEQVDKSINQYFGKIIFRRLSSINKGFYLGSSLYLKNDYEYDAKNLNELKKVKVDDIKNAARKYLKITNPIALIVK